MFPVALDLWVAFLIAYFMRPWAGVIGLAAGAALASLIVAALAVAWQLPFAAALYLLGDTLFIQSHAVACGLFALVFRGFLNGAIQRWWRLL